MTRRNPQPAPPDGEELRSASELLPLVYDELRLLARRQLRRGPHGGTLQTTALVHEAWLKVGGARPELEISRPHFLALAATAMRHVLANHAESRAAAKRGGGGWRKVTLSDAVAPDSERGTDLIAVSETLEELWTLNARHGRLAELRLLSGMSMEECSHVMGLSLSTAEREWRVVRAWFGAKLGRSG